MEFNQLLQLVEKVAASGLNEFDYETGDFKLHLGRKMPKMIPVSGNTLETQAGDRMISVPETAVIEGQEKEPEKMGKAVVSPIVGVFYAASSPDAEPFVKVGDTVKAGQVIGIVEAMKLMNEIESDVSGVVTEICVGNGESVEYGQPLIRVQE